MLAVVATSYEQEAGSGGDEDDDEDDEDEDEDVSANRPTLIECSLPGHRVFYGVYWFGPYFDVSSFEINNNGE